MGDTSAAGPSKLPQRHENNPVVVLPGRGLSKLPPVVFYHDCFNLVALAALNALNFSYIATGRNFLSFWYACMLYFIADLVWVAVVPR